MDADQILAIPLNQPWKLFPDPFSFTSTLQKLRKVWHPDLNPDKVDLCGKVMAHINALCTTWETDPSSRKAGALAIHSISGFGKMEIWPDQVVFLNDLGANDLVRNGMDQASSQKFNWPDAVMKDRISPVLPVFSQVPGGLKTCKPESQLNLLDVVNAVGPLPAVHVAWIISRLYNIGCFLQLQNRAHLDISLQSLFIDPEQHTAHLYGGWWYGKKFGEKALAAPQRTASLSSDFAATGIPQPSILGNQIRAVGRECFKARSIPALHYVKDLPKPMKAFLSKFGTEDLISEFAEWGKCLDESFGPRKFVKLDLFEKDIYKA